MCSMNQQSQGTSSLSSPDPPMKRKRGRPRKDENLVHAESATAGPGAESLKKNKQSTSDDVESEMVGQVVTGVIEGSFDAGYLLNVRVGDTDTQLRGVVFLQEKIAPITPANDIAPHIKMCKRKDIPIPPLNLQSQLYGSARPSEQSNRQPAEVKNQTPTVPDQTQSSIPGIPESLESKSFSVMIPPVDNLPKNDVGPSLEGKVMPQQILEPVTHSQSAPAMGQSELNNIVEQNKVLEEVEAAEIMEGPNSTEANKASKTESASEPVADIPGIDAVCKDPEIQTQAVDSEKSALVHDEVRSLDLELNQTPVVAEPAATAVIPADETVGIETICKDSQIQAVDVGPEKNALVHEVAKSLNIELNQTPVFAEPACVFSDLASKPVDIVMEEQAYPAPKPSQMFGGETVPSELKLASEGSIPPGMVEPHISSSSGAISNVDCDVEDVIPPTQS
ncbi:hypothetical protein PRUPE_4G022600 [Prunus persica]|uniref:AT hook motif-containing protein n=1 Tax=Prunus persica TaxID=3760 RepID=A0A251PHV3_PRUPE|nr:uncharacterized protein LOC18779131 isoform X2 [Prunus persica]ONI09995.1 hypothetical protein PRUPE_4G022600 [Prunus persica]ONI09996.1 hypothetical protein PRUPE_4G022600 [Prunus persica]ONI09997.1 hypothetical protein PRUPE_4G022600 [Prunus persica]ONI09998.1 hypothetical protein PRUPE_4G022600 [Prunus persica]